MRILLSDLFNFSAFNFSAFNFSAFSFLLFSFLALALLIVSSLGTLQRPWAVRQRTKLVARAVARAVPKAVFILGLVLLIGWQTMPAAQAELHFLKEADQWVYESRNILHDTEGMVWSTVVFKQMNGSDGAIYLSVSELSNPFAKLNSAEFDDAKLDGIRPNNIQLDAVQPLILITDTGAQLSAPNVTRQIFMGEVPTLKVSQYAVRSLLPQLRKTESLQLQIPTKSERPITINVPTPTLEEWQIVGTCDYLLCMDVFSRYAQVIFSHALAA